MMHLEYLKNEKHWGDAPFRPDLQGAVLEGKRGRILVTIFRAGGEGKHPTILLAHGIPGVEKNLDLAQGLRRVGFHVVTYHYSGSWNSAGDYGIGHCLEDSETVLEYIRNDTEMNFDTEKLYVVGHSMGVFIAAHLAAKHPELKAAVCVAPCDMGEGMMSEKGRGQMLAIFESAVPWLSGTSVQALFDETEQNKGKYQLSGLAEALKHTPVYVLNAKLDDECSADVHVVPWVTAVQAAGGDIIREEYVTDHSFSDMRNDLIEKVAQYLIEQVEK
ncbi:MAG: alpha/beta fold hydrolase [Anaerotignum sp.]|nr:alpha/beta fold hydrolase [Anaerotignum sp.]MBQ7085751.1 alpha/beta fold hydrolase [Anaerotignum sp.]